MTFTFDFFAGYQRLNSTEGAPAELPINARGLLSPAALAVVLRHAQRLLIGPTIDSLSVLTIHYTMIAFMFFGLDDPKWVFTFVMIIKLSLTL